MKKLFALLWISIIILTIACCVVVYSGKNDSKSGYGRAEAIQSSPEAFYNIQQKPTLPIVTPTQRATKAVGTDDRLGADFAAPSGKGTTVSEAEVVQDEEEKSSGDYVFPEEIYPYRAMLTQEQQSVYDRIYMSAMSCINKCTVREMISEDGLKDVMMAIYNDHPELFWLDTEYSYKHTSSGRVVEVGLGFNDTVNDFNNALNRFNSAAGEIIEGASRLADDEEKEKYVYDAIMDRVEYVASSPMNQSAYSALVNNESVCAGYSRAFQYIMQKLEIPCYFCSGYSNGGAHAWNIVKINGEYYNVDISWDDSLSNGDSGRSYRYYNVKDSKFSLSHTRRDLSVKLPKCE